MKRYRKRLARPGNQVIHELIVYVARRMADITRQVILWTADFFERSRRARVLNALLNLPADSRRTF